MNSRYEGTRVYELICRKPAQLKNCYNKWIEREMNWKHRYKKCLQLKEAYAVERN